MEKIGGSIDNGNPGALRCRIGYHRWDKWKMEGVVRESGGNPPASRPATQQSRVCIDCGKLEHRLARL